MNAQDQALAALARRWWDTADFRCEPSPQPSKSGMNAVVQGIDLIHGDQRRSCVIKRQINGQREQPAWAAMQAGEAPIPEWYAAWQDESGQEVLLIERLPLVGLDGRDARSFSDLVETVAGFNAVAAPDLADGPVDRVARWAGSLQRLWLRCQTGRFGPAVAAETVGLRDRWPEVIAWGRQLDRRLGEFPSVPTHHDPAFGNCGRRRPDGPVLLFDLGYIDRAPLGRDLALLLGGFAQASPPGIPRSHWLELWRSAFRLRSAIPIVLDELACAVDLYRDAQQLWMDDRTITQAEAAYDADPLRFHAGWGTWFAGKWRAVVQQVDGPGSA